MARATSWTRSRPPAGRCRVASAGSPRPAPATSKRCERCWSPNARHARCGSAPSVRLRHLMFTAPDELRQRLAHLSVNALVNEAARLRPRPDGDPVLRATKTAAVILARRVQALDAELVLLDTQLEPLVKATAPALLNVYGCRVRHRRHLAHRGRRQRRPDPFRSSLGQALRGRSDPRHVRQDHRPLPAQPGRQPPRQQRLVADRADPPRPTRTTHRRLHEPAPRRGQDQTRDLPLPQALRRPRGLPRPTALTHVLGDGTGPRMP